MGSGSNFLSAALNPIGYAARKASEAVGAGSVGTFLLDPIAGASQMAAESGNTQMANIIDPAWSMREQKAKMAKGPEYESYDSLLQKERKRRGLADDTDVTSTKSVGANTKLQIKKNNWTGV